MNTSDLSIDQLGPKGDGIHIAPEGRVYVERALPGDRVQARIFEDMAGIFRAEIIDVLRPSPHRSNPPCVHYDNCGNCSLQHLETDYYQEWKVAVVKETLARFGVPVGEWLPPVFLAGGNRRRATFTAQKIYRQLVMGYYRRRSQEITDIDSCLVADPRLLAVRKSLQPFLSDLVMEWTKIDIFIQLVGNEIDLMITGPVGPQSVPDARIKDLLEGLALTSNLSRVSWRAEMGATPVVIADINPVVAHFSKLRVTLPPGAFLQPTVEGEKILSQAILDATPQSTKFADLFSGCGTFSGRLLDRGSVEAFEADALAVKALAAAGSGKALKATKRDLYSNPLQFGELNRFDAVIFDPPRGGCPEQAKELARASTPLLVGISCNPATFARDASIICRGGYRLKSVQVIDQFLWSHHTEVVGVFVKP